MSLSLPDTFAVKGGGGKVSPNFTSPEEKS